MAHLTRNDGTAYNVVNAEERGDRCFIGKRGFFWYDYTDKWAIDEATVSGPFMSFEAAFEAAEAKLLLLPVEVPPQPTSYVITQTQLNRLREICQIGIQSHSDEFYERIMTTLDEVEQL